MRCKFKLFSTFSIQAFLFGQIKFSYHLLRIITPYQLLIQIFQGFYSTATERAEDHLLFINGIVMTISIGLLIGRLFLQVGNKTGYSGTSSNVEVLVMGSFMGALNPVKFPAEREVFIREENLTLYSTAAYFTICIFNKYAFESLIRDEFKTRSNEFDNKTIQSTNPLELWRSLVILAGIIIFFRFAAVSIKIQITMIFINKLNFSLKNFSTK